MGAPNAFDKEHTTSQTFTSQKLLRILLKSVELALNWTEKCMEYEVEGSRSTDRTNRTWREVVEMDCQTRKFNEEDAVDCSRWRKLINSRPANPAKCAV